MQHVKWLFLIIDIFCYRLLQISSFNGKMNALNEVNKVISSVSYYTHRHGNPEEEEWLTAERMAVSHAAVLNQIVCMTKLITFSCYYHWIYYANKTCEKLRGCRNKAFDLYLHISWTCICFPQEWIQQNNILSIVLRDSLHQPQYVEKLEKILRFVIKEKALTLQDLDNIWAAQVRHIKFLFYSYILYNL